MEKNRKICLKLIKENGVIIGEFENIHGEPFIVYSLNGNENDIYVTSSELDWEVGFKWNGESLVYKTYHLTPEENEKIDDCLQRKEINDRSN